MYGYVVPIRRRLSDGAKEQYHADYCGLCRCLGKRYGFLARFTVSYDMTFFYALLAADRKQGQAKKCFCPANPFCKKQCRMADAPMELAADVSMLLTAGKLRDTMADSGWMKRQIAKFLLLLFRRKERKAATILPRQRELIAEQLERLSRLEQQHCDSIDRTADTFAVLLRDLIDPAYPNAPILQSILYHTGRYLYLIDALDDLQKDVKHDNYNPLRYRYRLQGDRLSEEDRKQLLLSVEASIDRAAAAFDLLEPDSHRELLDNIIRFGMPTVMTAVATGRFHRKRKTGETYERPL